MATTTRGHLREFLASALTPATTTTDLVTSGIAFTEGTTIERKTSPRGCYVLAAESREMSEISEDEHDRSGEADVAIRCEQVITDGDLYDTADALFDAVERALEGAETPDPFTHPETGVVMQITGASVGLFTPAHFNHDSKQIACIVVYAAIRYERLTY